MGNGPDFVAEDRVYVLLANIPGSWAVVSEVTKSAPASKVADGGGPEQTIFGKPTISEMTLQRPWNKLREPGLLQDLLDKVGVYFTTGTKVIEDPTGVILDSLHYAVGIQSASDPKGDRSSSAPATIQIVVSVDSIS